MAFSKKSVPQEGQEPSEGPSAKKGKVKSKRAKSAKPAKPAKGGRGKRFVFIVGDDGCILTFMQGMKVVRRLFAPSAQPSHTEAMLEIVNANPGVPLYMLVDVLDQQYVPQTFPPVSSMSVGGLVKRRLDRDFQTDDLKNSLLLGRDKTGRKEWRYLLVALAKTPLISEWIDLIGVLPNEFKGIYLVPIESINYMAALNRQLGNAEPKPWQMLISHNKVSGFRQVVAHNGKLVFTRVSQAIDDAIPAVIAGNIEQEIINTLEYLKRLEFKDEGLLDIKVVVSHDVSDSLDLKRFGFSGAHVLTPLAVAEALGLEQAALSADRFGDVVMAAAFGVAKKRILRFSTAFMDRLTKLYQAKAALKVASALVVVACAGLMLMSAVSIVQGYSATTEAEEADKKLQPDLNKMHKMVSGINTDVAHKSAVVSAYDVYLKNAPLPAELAKALAKLSNQQTRITNFTWQYAAPTAKGGAPTNPVESKIDVDLANAANEPEKLTIAADAMVQSLKSALPEYEIAAEPYKWSADKSENNLSLNAAATTISAEKKTMTITLHGPKKGKAP